MRIIIIIITFGLFGSCNTQHHEKKTNDLKLEFENIESIHSLSILFDNSVVKGNRILWPMGYQDIYEFKNELSSDGLCHTMIDTVIKWDNKYFVIFRTDQTEEEFKATCHACCPDIGIASFEKNQNGYKLLNFKKHVFQFGGFGNYGTIFIDTLCFPVIKVSSGWASTGAVITYDNYYEINDFSFLYDLTTYSSNSGNYNDDEANFEEITKVIVNKNDSSFIIKTSIIRNDSLNVKHMDKYFERITWYNDNGAVDIKTSRIE